MARASELVALAQSWIGKNEANGSFKEIIDIYNSHKPLARGYKVKYTDEWCATHISALAIKCNATNIIPKECGCGEMIKLFQKMGCWVENDGYTPKMGDIIFYDWDDNGKGDNVGWADHVGIVEMVSGNTIIIIEGNYNSSVKRRQLQVNGKYIRGYGVPKYEPELPKEEPKKETPKKETPKKETPKVEAPKPASSVMAKDSAKSFITTIAGTYQVTTALNIRHGAGVLKKKMVVAPKGTKVRCYGYYTSVAGVKWYYIQFTLNGVKYTGFASSKYLKRV